jgi:ankyrin repeat protein
MEFLRACKDGNLRIMQSLLPTSNPNQCDRFHSALLYAVEGNHTEIALQLIEHGANVNYKKPLTHESPLIVASKLGNLDVVKSLIQHGSDINHKSYSVTNAMMGAAEYGHDKIVAYLIIYGCKQENSILIAVSHYQYKVVSLLLPYTPKHLCITAAYTSIVKKDIYLLNLFLSKISPNSSNIEPLLITCVRDEWIQGIDSLLEKGASVNITNHSGDTALLYAVLRKNVNIIRCLLDHGANVNLQNKHDVCPLSLACFHDMYDIAELLLQHGANVENPGRDGETVLLKTIYNGNDTMVPLLLKYDANPYAIIHGKNAMMYAKVKKYTQIIRLLEEVDQVRYVQNSTNHIIHSLCTTTLDYIIWKKYLQVDVSQTLQHMIHMNYVDRMACFTALFQGEDKQLQLYRQDKPNSFSQSTLRQIVRLYRPIKNLIMSYTIYSLPVHQLFKMVH